MCSSSVEDCHITKYAGDIMKAFETKMKGHNIDKSVRDNLSVF